MRLCYGHGVPVVPQGGLTGLAGGARPIAGSVVISLERFTGIEEIDPDASTMTVRAGTPLESVQRAADEAGFIFALDLGSRGSCTVGGNLGTNAGGNRVLRYGMMRELVLGLEVVLPDGTLVTSLNYGPASAPAPIRAFRLKQVSTDAPTECRDERSPNV
jgi:FAD/FMN-containing dehydrogenase